MLNNIKLKGHPCRTLFLQSKKSVLLLNTFTAHEDLEYMSIIVFRKDPFTLRADPFTLRADNSPVLSPEFSVFPKSLIISNYK